MEWLILEEKGLDVVSPPNASSFVRSIPTFFLQKCLNIDKRKSKPKSLNSLSLNDDTSAIRYPNFAKKQSLDDSLLWKFPRYIYRQHFLYWPLAFIDSVFGPYGHLTYL